MDLWEVQLENLDTSPDDKSLVISFKGGASQGRKKGHWPMTGNIGPEASFNFITQRTRLLCPTTTTTTHNSQLTRPGDALGLPFQSNETGSVL